MLIRVVLPVTGETAESCEEARLESAAWVTPGTDVDVVALTHGPASIESEYDEALAAPGVLDLVAAAAADGVDAVFVSCFGDPGVAAARELVDIPVVGGFEPAMLTALTYGDRAGVVTVLDNVLPMLDGLVLRHGIERRVAPMRVIDLPVLGLDDRATMVERLIAESVASVRDGGADVIVLGCTGMLGVAAAVRDGLLAAGLDVPVVDPTAAATTWLERAVRLGLRNSRTTYARPTVSRGRAGMEVSA